MDGEITVDELESLLDGDGADDESTGDPDDGDANPTIVDIRNPDAFAHGHIPGSENIPAPELTDRVAELDGADHVVTVCPHGQASVQAARLVGSYEGVDGPVESLHGGLEAWEGPLARADGDDDNAAGDGGADEGPTAPF
jgi:rhodanese-related sulfurtransferase